MSTDEQTYEDEWKPEVEAQPPDKCPASVSYTHLTLPTILLV